MDLAGRFWAKVDKSEGCWEWTGAKGAKGGGIIRVDGRIQYAHRVAWLLTYGSFPEGELAQSCGRRLCVRPEHLCRGGGGRKERPARRVQGGGAVGGGQDRRIGMRASAGRSRRPGKRREIRRVLPHTTSGQQVGEEVDPLRTEGGDGADQVTGRTFGDLVLKWMAQGEVSWSPSTIALYRAQRTYLEPLWEIPVRELSAERIEDLYADLRQAGRRDGGGLSLGALRNVHCVIAGALKAGRRCGWVRVNPAAGLDLGAVNGERTEPVPPSASTIRSLLEAAVDVDPDFPLYLRMSVITGGRRGEVHALRFSDVEVPAQRLAISRTLVRGPAGWVEKPAMKGGRVRYVSLDGATLDLVDSCWRRKQELGLAVGRRASASDVVFGAFGEPWNPRTTWSRFEQLCAAVGVENCRLRDLRHFMSSQLIGAGLPITVVQHRMGYAHPLVTLDVSSRMINDGDQVAAEVMSIALDGEPE